VKYDAKKWVSEGDYLRNQFMVINTALEIAALVAEGNADPETLKDLAEAVADAQQTAQEVLDAAEG